MGRKRGQPSDSGGPNAPRRPNGNIDWDRVYSEYLRPIIKKQQAPNTIRGLMYILKSQGVLKKSDYNVLDKRLVDWRLAGKIRWNQIADGSGRGLVGDFPSFQSPERWANERVNDLKNATEGYHKLLNEEWRWYGQPKYVTFMSEKQAVTGTVYAYVKDKYVKISYNRGNNGWGWASQYARKLRRELHYLDIETDELKRRDVYVWYLGDDDSYGRHMDIELRNQLREFGILNQIHFKRIAVLPEQVSEYGIPLADEGGGYEIDALNAYRPDLFKELLLDHTDGDYFDEDIHDKLLEKFSEDYIDKIVNKKVNFLDNNDGKQKEEEQESKDEEDESAEDTDADTEE